MIKHTKPIAIILCEMSTPTAVQVFAVLRPSNLNLFNIVPGFVMKRWKEWCAACAGSVLKYEKICNRRQKFQSLSETELKFCIEQLLLMII